MQTNNTITKKRCLPYGCMFLCFTAGGVEKWYSSDYEHLFPGKGDRLAIVSFVGKRRVGRLTWNGRLVVGKRKEVKGQGRAQI
jgi:hypothetical protein